MKKWCLAAVLMASFLPLALAETELNPEQFMDVARRPPGRECWAKMTGTATHLRSGGKPEEATLTLAVLFTPDRTLAKMKINDSQGYLVGQKYGAGPDMTSIIPLDENGYKEPILAKFGLRPEDLTMTFIFWKFIKEMPREEIKGQECRVMILQSPQTDAPEKVKVFISAKYFFPLKVEWIKGENDTTYRTMEITSFRKENDYWLVSTMIIYGSGWKTKINFDAADAGEKKDLPKDFF